MDGKDNITFEHVSLTTYWCLLTIMLLWLKSLEILIIQLTLYVYKKDTDCFMTLTHAHMVKCP